MIFLREQSKYKKRSGHRSVQFKKEKKDNAHLYPKR